MAIESLRRGTADAERAALTQDSGDADKRGRSSLPMRTRGRSGRRIRTRTLWDNGADAAEELDRVLAGAGGGAQELWRGCDRPGTPMAQLEETLVPLYLLHRYQTEAAIKLIGGLDYRYNLRGDGQAESGDCGAGGAEEGAGGGAEDALAGDADAAGVDFASLLPPTPPGYPRTQESFPSHTGLTFDPVAAAESAADLTLTVLLDPARASRLIEYHMRVPGSLRCAACWRLCRRRWRSGRRAGTRCRPRWSGRWSFAALEAMLALAVNPEASSQARAIARSHIADVLKQLTRRLRSTDTAEAIHRAALIERIEEFERDPAKFVPAPAVEAPPGMPIGDDEDSMDGAQFHFLSTSSM
jgi:hypothetical protein